MLSPKPFGALLDDPTASVPLVVLKVSADRVTCRPDVVNESVFAPVTALKSTSFVMRFDAVNPPPFEPRAEITGGAYYCW